MKLTKEQAVVEHRRMWNWIAQQYRAGERYNVEEMKRRYISGELGKSPDLICNHCFCCEYSVQVGNDSDGPCDNCPIKWPSDVEEYFCIDAYEPDGGKGLYAVEYLLSIQPACDVRRLVYLAEQIANLPEVE